MNTPVARPAAGEKRAAEIDRDRDDSFARILDDRRDDRDSAVETETARPAPAQAADKSTPKQRNGGDAETQATDEAPQAEAAATKGSETPVAPGIIAAIATTQASTAPLLLGATAADDSGNNKTADGSEITALPGFIQPLTPQTAKPASQATGASHDVIPPTEAGSGDVPQLPPGDIAAQPNGMEAGKAGKAADAPAAASAETKTQSPAQAAVQPAATASPDNAVKAAVDTSAPAPQAATQASTTSNPLSDASRATATPPALQSAPAATIEVYSRIIERADGRAQRFEVRLDPAELGRVDVRIEIGADKKVHAVLAAHDSAALSDLMRGQRALERALSEAGIDLADNGVRFEMSNDANRGNANQQQGDAGARSGQPDVWRNFNSVMMPVSAETAAAAVPVRRSQRLDLVA